MHQRFKEHIRITSQSV